jgi:glycosyltransferase involved in cell wall biosynthesis
VRVSGKPKVLVLTATWPHITGSVQAAEVVPYEIVRCLAQNEGCEVVYGCAAYGDVKLTPAAQAGIAALERLGVRFLPFIHMPPWNAERGRLEKWFRMLVLRDPACLVPGYGQHEPIAAALRALGWTPDVVIPVWNYELTAAAVGLPCAMYAFYGNPEFKVYEANLGVMWRWERRWNLGWLARHFADRLRVRAFKAEHLRMMRRIALIAENAANDYELYRACGVKGVHYLRNMWPATTSDDWVARRDATERTTPIKIAGNVGQLNATANTFGLWTLGEEILPALKRRIGSGNFEVQIYGRFEPRPFIKRWLTDPDVAVRGFVDDIDAELLSCPVYLLANNRHGFKVGHTRILHAFALGACVVAWRDIAVAMPELKHDENVLLADSADEMAELVAAAGRDHALRRRIGRAGFETLGTLFRPEASMAEMGRRIRALVGGEHRLAA